MLLAVTAFGVWLGWYVNRAERQRKAVEWAEQNGGHVIYAFQLHENLRHQNVAHWPGPTWIGIDYLSPVWGISFSRGGLKEIGQLKDLPSLRILGLYDGPSDLQVLSKLRQLQILTISGCPICDISPVAHLRKLTKLTIEGAPVEDIAAISSLTSLESISFYNTSVRDLSPLSTLKKLKRVNFSNSRIGDLAPIANLRSMLMLSVSGTEIDDITALSNCSNLQYLNLGDTKVSDLTPLTGLKELRTLNLGHSSSKAGGVKFLLDELPQCKIWNPHLIGRNGDPALFGGLKAFRSFE